MAPFPLAIGWSVVLSRVKPANDDNNLEMMEQEEKETCALMIH